MSPHSRAQKSVQTPIVVPANIIVQCVLPCATGTNGPSEDLQMRERLIHFQGPRSLYQATVNKLPDDALLDIFYSYLNDNVRDRLENVEEWHALVHVCQRWRNVVFASPRRLNLRLLCRRHRPVRAMLDIWPALPIEIEGVWTETSKVGLDNIIAALEQPDRVYSIFFYNFSSSVEEALVAEMQVPFPELKFLALVSDDRSTPVLPDSFLGGSIPRLRTLTLGGILFPALPNLLLSPSDLVVLSLTRFPHSGYISPETMAACLSSLNGLKSLDLGFESPRSRPNQPSPPPQTRVVLPALTDLYFRGMVDYLEGFLAHIDTPVLNQLSISFFLDLVFDVPHLEQFISRAKGLKLSKVARVEFDIRSIRLLLAEPHSLSLEIMCDRIDWQVNAISLVCNQLSPFLSLVERLGLIADHLRSNPQGEDDFESSQFLELFRPFTTIQSLHVSKSLVLLVTPALQELIGERATEVLPNLRYHYSEGYDTFGTVQRAMQPFVTARELAGEPVALRYWTA